KTLICLANSRKIAGRCVAGKEIVAGKIGNWIRPVSGRPSGEVSEEERRFEDGQDPILLDVIRIPMIEPRPHGAQTENHLIDDSEYWIKEREANWNELCSALDAVDGSLWDNDSSGSNGRYDRVAEAKVAKLPDSLKLIEVKDFKIEVALE